MYDQYVGKEDIDHEYKEFTMNVYDICRDKSIAEKLVETSKWEFNEIVINSLFDIIKLYLPKYIAGFMCGDSESSNGTLQIGINDDGILQGIPYLGNLEGDIDIADIVNNVIDNMIVCEEHADIELIKKYVTYSFSEINYNYKPVDNVTPFLAKYRDVIARLEGNIISYKKNYDEWYQRFTRYVTRLTYLVNDIETRHELCDYIKLHEPSSTVIDLLESPYILEYLGHIELSPKKLDSTTPYYWVCRWKDENIQRLLLEKPKRCFEYKPYFSPIKILEAVSPMIPYWMENNKGIRLYTLKFSLKKPLKNINIKYLDSVSGNLIKCYRTIYNVPCCLPF